MAYQRDRNTALGRVMTELARARGWLIDLYEPATGQWSALSRGGPPGLDRPEIREAFARLPAATACRRPSHMWGNAQGRTDGPDLFFCAPLDAETRAYGCVVFAQSCEPSPVIADPAWFVDILSDFIAADVRSRTSERRASALGRLLEGLAFSCIVTDAGGRVIFASAAGRNALLRRLVKGSGNPATVRGRIRRIIDETMAGIAGSGGAATSYCKPTLVEGEAVGPLYVLPLETPGGGDGASDRFFAILQPQPASATGSETLRAAYALTPAEARVVERIVRGLTVKDISRDLGLSTQTVRTYLKRSLGKVGVSSQPQLVSKIGRYSIPLRSPEAGT